MRRLRRAPLLRAPVVERREMLPVLIDRLRVFARPVFRESEEPFRPPFPFFPRPLGIVPPGWVRGARPRKRPDFLCDDTVRIGCTDGKWSVVSGQGP